MASSSQRNPKDIKDLIERCKSGLEYREESAKKMEMSECQLLNARIDEQNRLIIFYKQRGDDYLQKIQSLERINQVLNDQRPFKFFKIDSRRARSEAQFIDELVRDMEKTEV